MSDADLTLVDKSSSKTIAEYEYDGLNRRIVKDVDTDDDGTPDEKQHFYYNESWQVLEVRKDASTDPYKQYVWHTYYIDALAYRYHDLNGDGDTEDGLEFWHYTHDANMNVTALIADGTGNVIERYRYNAYGQPIFLDANWAGRSDGCRNSVGGVAAVSPTDRAAGLSRRLT